MSARAAEPTILESVQWGHLMLWLVVGVLLMLGTLLAWRRTEGFLIKDTRFRIAEPDEIAGQSPDLVVEGIHYASTSQIRHVFAQDFGRSLYLAPIQERRRQLLQIDWVEDATVSKVWPKTLKVRIRERIPVAFVHLLNRKDGMSRFALIDRDGFILRPRVAAQFTLPVVTGVRENESTENRRARVHRVLGLLKSVGAMSSGISEINAADPNNLVVAEHVDNDVVNLMMGDDNYAERLTNFLSSYPEMKSKRPDVKTFDLRTDGVITAVGDNRVGQ